MSRSSRITLWLAFFALAVPALVPASSKIPRKPAGKKASSQPAEAPRPPLPQELPPVAPTVTYRSGQLTIVAANSTLFDILTAVHKATGAAVEAPAASAGERVATRLGPGRPREVLTALLDGSQFNYILLGSSQDPAEVRRLILTSRSGGGAAVTAAPGIPPAAMVSRPAVRPVPPSSSEDEDASPEQSAEPAEETPTPQRLQPEVKSPEQLQQELRQQEEQQRQQQLQQQQEQQPQEQPQ